MALRRASQSMSFEYQWSGLENGEVVDAEVVTKERFDVYLMGGDDSVRVAVECDEEIM